MNVKLSSAGLSTPTQKVNSFKRVGELSFRTTAPSVWNSLPTSVLNFDSLTLFKARIKTYLFFSLLF